MRFRPILIAGTAVALVSAACGTENPAPTNGTTLPGQDTVTFDVGKTDTAGGDTKADSGPSACKTNCDDGNVCTDDQCDTKTATCISIPNKAACDDGDPCTGGDICGGGTCKPGTVDTCTDGGVVPDGGTPDATPDTGTPPVGPDLQPGELIITEIFYNPYGGGLQDADAEWLELYNPADKVIDLGGLVVKGGDKETFVVPAGAAKVNPKTYVVLGASADKAKNGGVQVDVVYGKAIVLVNTADSVTIESNGVVIDTVAYDTAKGWPNLNGVSLALSPSATDATSNDQAANWCGATTVLATGDKATPGAANDFCKVDGDKDGIPDGEDNCPTIANPTQQDTNKNGIGDICEGPVPTCGNSAIDAGEVCDDGNKNSGDGCSAYCKPETAVAPGSLIFTEIMTNPAKVEDDVGEWIEIRNVSAQPVTLNGVILQTGTLSPIQHAIAGPDPIVVEAGAFFLLGKTADVALSGGVKPNYVYGKIVLSSTAATLSLVSAGKTIDQVAYNTEWPLFTGKTLSLDPTVTTAEANDNPGAWCKGQTTYGSGDFGSPGTANPSCAGIDDDEDKDGIPDKTDNCKSDKNTDQLDKDTDGIGDACDNCPDDLNPDQADGDKDGQGDACEPPGCGNGVVEKGEGCDDGNVKPGDGCSPACQAEAKLEAGALILTEALPDASAVTDTVGEWVEIYNPGTVDVEMAGLTVVVTGTSGPTTSTLLSDVSVPLKPGAYFVIARNGDVAVNGGVTANWVAATLSLGNTGPIELRLEKGGVIIDTISYGGSGWPAITAGMSLQLDPGKFNASANDAGAAWCLGSVAYGKGDKGTPGAVNSACPKDTDGDGKFDSADNCPLVANGDQKDFDADKVGDVCDNCPADANTDQKDTDNNGKGDVCQDKPVPVCGDKKVEFPETCDDGAKVPGDGCDANCQSEVTTAVSPGDIVIHEVMYNPTAAPDADGEWFELKNVTTKAIDLNGAIFLGKGSEKFTVGKSVVVPAGGYVTFGVKESETVNGGVKHAYVYPAAFALGNSDDVIDLQVGGVSIDKVTYLTSGGWPNANGASIQLSADKATAAANDDGKSWCLSAVAFGKGDKGSPNADNAVCAAPPPGAPAPWYVPVPGNPGFEMWFQVVQVLLQVQGTWVR